MRFRRVSSKRATAAATPAPRAVASEPPRRHLATPPARIYSLQLGPGYERR